MDRIRYFAEMSVRRAAGFGLLAIGLVVVACGYDPPLALRVLAILLSVEALVLYHCSLGSHRVPCRRREVWLLLDGRPGMGDRAQDVISRIMAETFAAYARRLAGPAAAAWIADLGFRLFG